MRNGLPFPSVRDLPDPGVKPASYIEDTFFTAESPQKPYYAEFKQLNLGIIINTFLQIKMYSK